MSYIEHATLCLRWNVEGEWANFRCHSINKSNIRKRSSRHDFIISSSRSVWIEIFHLNTSFSQIFRCWWSFWNISSGANMISCDGISKKGQATSTFYAWYLIWFHICEERWIMNVCRVLIPLVTKTLFHLELIPTLISSCDCWVNWVKHFWF